MIHFHSSVMYPLLFAQLKFERTDENRPYGELVDVEDSQSDDEVFEVGRILAICYGDSGKKKERKWVAS